MTPVGRRPGRRDTRAEIVDAARAAFTERGYDGASLRGIARDAGVDPSLVHHYFDGKASLFVAALDLPADPRAIKEQVETTMSMRREAGRAGGSGPEAGGGRPAENDQTADGPPSTSGPDRPISGAVVVELFLAQWEDGEPPGSRFRAMAQAVSSSPSVADATRQFLAERVWSRIPRVAGEDETGAARRSALVSAQLVGLAWGRYVLRTEPLVSAPLAEIGRWAGPALDRYMAADLDS
jgi:AcrR family transcriptional regulator